MYEDADPSRGFERLRPSSPALGLGLPLRSLRA